MQNNWLPCEARKMPVDHNSRTARFIIPPDIQHGQFLICSHPICRHEGVKFRYCTFCNQSFNKYNFYQRHTHNQQLPQSQHQELQRPHHSTTCTSTLAVATREAVATSSTSVPSLTNPRRSSSNNDDITCQPCHPQDGSNSGPATELSGSGLLFPPPTSQSETTNTYNATTTTRGINSAICSRDQHMECSASITGGDHHALTSSGPSSTISSSNNNPTKSVSQMRNFDHFHLVRCAALSQRQQRQQRQQNLLPTHQQEINSSSLSSSTSSDENQEARKIDRKKKQVHHLHSTTTAKKAVFNEDHRMPSPGKSRVVLNEKVTSQENECLEQIRNDGNDANDVRDNTEVKPILQIWEELFEERPDSNNELAMSAWLMKVVHVSEKLNERKIKKRKFSRHHSSRSRSKKRRTTTSPKRPPPQPSSSSPSSSASSPSRKGHSSWSSWPRSILKKEKTTSPPTRKESSSSFEPNSEASEEPRSTSICSVAANGKMTNTSSPPLSSSEEDYSTPKVNLSLSGGPLLRADWETTHYVKNAPDEALPSSLSEEEDLKYDDDNCKATKTSDSKAPAITTSLEEEEFSSSLTLSTQSTFSHLQCYQPKLSKTRKKVRWNKRTKKDHHHSL